MDSREKVEQEIAPFYKINDGYKKIVICMDFSPFSQLKDKFRKVNLFDFLLEKVLLF